VSRAMLVLAALALAGCARPRVAADARRGSAVTIRDDRVLLVDGTPFFPLGAYRDPSDTLTDFAGLKEAGFNLTHSYAFEDSSEQSPATARRYLEAAHANGLKVFMGFQRTRVKNRDWAWCRRWAAALKDCPALLTWYLMDEPTVHGIPAGAMREFHQVVKAVDPCHPTAIVYCRAASFKQYAPCSDLFWTDPYPIPNRPLTMVERLTQLARAAAGPQQPVWVVLQAHDLRYWRRYQQAARQLGPPSRPTCRESRCMAFLALASGADGLIWYWGPNRMYHMQQHAPTVWKGLCDVVHELQGLMPFLVARRTAEPTQAPEPFRLWTREAGGQRVLAVINASPKPAKAVIDLSQYRVERVLRRRTGQGVLVVGGRIAASFEPYEVRVYQWAVAP